MLGDLQESVVSSSYKSTSFSTQELAGEGLIAAKTRLAIYLFQKQYVSH
jgi:hypothetical protein